MVRPFSFVTIVLASLCLSFCLGLCGCGKKEVAGRPKLFPVSGVVTFEGQPAAGAVVMFAPQDHQFAATAKTQADGTFRLRTFEEGDGAAEGNYKVVVYKVDVHLLEDGGVREEHHFPKKYKSADSTPLTAVVSGDQKNDLTLQVAK